jgi:16S rRNA (guanine966-N2)-methyltransferase
VRIIGGSAKGRRLISPKIKNLRPTQDRVREALFNILGASIENSVFLDLFAGTGAVGLEALSRGARMAIFNDINASAVKLLKENIERSHFSDQAKCYTAEANELLRRHKLPRQLSRSQIIFLDPPYDFKLYRPLFSGLARLKEQTICILEHRAKLELENFPGFDRYDQRIYGDTALSFYIPEKNLFSPKTTEDYATLASSKTSNTT